MNMCVAYHTRVARPPATQLYSPGKNRGVAADFSTEILPLDVRAEKKRRVRVRADCGAASGGGDCVT
jgi:hypothetical protein